MAMHRTINRYEISRELGRGGFGLVYLAYDPFLDAEVAIKLLAREHSQNSLIVERFTQEARLLRSLGSHGIVDVFDYGHIDNQPYFVMEYCRGGTMRDRLASFDGPIDIEEAIQLGTAISLALGPIHDRSTPVVHRDINPGNLLIRELPSPSPRIETRILKSNEQLVVSDFGLAKMLHLQWSDRRTLSAYTRGYAAPEQVHRTTDITPAADIYSAAIVLASALLNKPPREVSSADDLAFSRIEILATGCLGPLILRSLSYEPSERHQSASEWGQELEYLSQIDTSPISISSPDPRPHATHKFTWRVAHTIGLALAMLIVLLGLVVMQFLDAGPEIVGPNRGRLGDRAVFFVEGSDVVLWETDGVREYDRVFALQPQSLGTIEIVAVTTDGTISTQYTAERGSSELRILGSSILSVGDEVILGVDKPEGTGQPRWSVPHVDFDQLADALEVTPYSQGTLTVGVDVGGMGYVERTFTVLAASY